MSKRRRSPLYHWEHARACRALQARWRKRDPSATCALELHDDGWRYQGRGTDGETREPRAWHHAVQMAEGPRPR